MRKIVILVITIFFLTGCYDNMELNNINIITGLGVDYQDNNFYVTYEVVNTNKTENNSQLLSYTISGTGKSIAEAIINANYKIDKKAYFAHLKIVILSENIINGKLEEITDYLFRDNEIRDEFNVVVAKNATPEEILKHNSDKHPDVSDLIYNLLNNEKYNNSLATNEIYQNIYAKILSDNYDIILSSVSIKDKKITLDDSYIFNNYNYQNTLNKQESFLFNLLQNKALQVEFSKDYKKGNLTIRGKNAKSKIDVTDNKIKINLDIEGVIVENNPDFNLKEEKTYQMLNQDFGQIIQNDIINFVQKLQINQTDILGFQEYYYRKYNKNNHSFWLNAELEVNVNLKINRKGFIFEVKDEK